jgi:hypothetical protein
VGAVLVTLRSSRRFRYLDREGVCRPEHVRPENNPLLIGCEADIRLESVLVFRHIDQALRMKHSRVD